MTLTERLSRAEGSAILKKVLLGMHNAEVTCLQARDRITALEAENATLRRHADELAETLKSVVETANLSVCKRRASTAVDKYREALTKYREGTE